MKKALIAMSGGVDSGVAAYLTKQAGYDCIGVTMRLYDGAGERENSCCSLSDVLDAADMARHIGIPHHTFNFKSDFEKEVISRFIAAYEQGATPNPCIECNRYLKFEALYERAKALGCDYIVTGHYARIEEKDGKYMLLCAKDKTKDQSYVLYSLTQEKLAHTLFPLGNLSKTEARTVAAANGLVSADKPDSQDICFIPDGDYASFIRKHTGREYPAGDFIDTKGNILGRHKGIINYTVGQRKGLGIALGAPAYVKDIDVKNNRVILCDNEGLFTDELIAGDFNWICGEAPKGEIHCMAAVRYRGTLREAIATPISKTEVHIKFLKPQRAITRGQAAVLYDGNIVLGGGTIE